MSMMTLCNAVQPVPRLGVDRCLWIEVRRHRCDHLNRRRHLLWIMMGGLRVIERLLQRRAQSRQLRCDQKTAVGAEREALRHDDELAESVEAVLVRAVAEGGSRVLYRNWKQHHWQRLVTLLELATEGLAATAQRCIAAATAATASLRLLLVLLLRPLLEDTRRGRRALQWRLKLQLVAGGEQKVTHLERADLAGGHRSEHSAFRGGD